jgi:NADH:ubiquinone oxidoreductase subunit 5 (subunit L)/multisubunit Na+/H+ antiporter MnhA subunit
MGGELGESMRMWGIGVGLLLGMMCKSAQGCMGGWLTNAMAGPTLV